MTSGMRHGHGIASQMQTIGFVDRPDGCHERWQPSRLQPALLVIVTVPISTSLWPFMYGAIRAGTEASATGSIPLQFLWSQLRMDARECFETAFRYPFAQKRRRPVPCHLPSIVLVAVGSRADL